MSDHAPFPPSAAYRWMRCPGSVAACRNLPNVDNVYSREGTFAHAHAAGCLMLGQSAAMRIGRRSENREFTVDAAMAEFIQQYLDAVMDLVLLEGGTLSVEQKVYHSPQVYGTSDAILLSDDRSTLDVLDLKYGAGKLVPATDNEQLSIYAIGAANRAGIPLRQLKRCRMHIVQPRRPDAEGQTHRTAEVTGEELAEFDAAVSAAVRAAREPNAKLVPGDHCGFCPASATCPALRARALQVAQSVFPAGPEQPATHPPVADMTPEQLAKVLPGLDVVEAWVKAVRAWALDLARRGSPILGWKLFTTLSNRQWLDEAAAVARLSEAGADPYAPRRVVSPAQAEKLLGKARGKFVAALTARTVSGVKLVPESDKRPAANPGDVFAALPEGSNDA